MISSFWNTIVITPLSQILQKILFFLPNHDLGLAVILFTILIKIILIPLTYKATKSQIELKKVQPELEKIKKDFPNKEDQARETFALYKTHNINPFSGCLPILIQLPILLGLYYVIQNFITNTTLGISTVFLGITDIAGPSIILAILAGVTQFIQMHYSLSMQQPTDTNTNGQPNFMQFQMKTMKYVLPVFIAFVAMKFSGIVALYWVVNNIITMVSEYFIKKSIV